MSCECEVCQEAKEFNKNILKIKDLEVRKFFTNLYDSYVSLGADRDRLKSIIQDTWPDSDRIIKETRLQYKLAHPEDHI